MTPTSANSVLESKLPSASEDDWEDVPTIGSEERKRSSTPSPANSVSGQRLNQTPRKRKVPHKVAHTGSPLRRPAAAAAAPSPTPKQPKAPAKLPTRGEIVDGALDGANFTAKYIFDVFSTAIRLLRRPLYLIASLWLLALIISYVSSTLQGAFAPLCYVPGLRGICHSAQQKAAGKEKTPQWADYPRLVDMQSKTFGRLLEESVGGADLSLEIKKSEMATTDLVTLVRISNLKSKEMLADSLTEFVADARKSGRDLQKLSSKVGGAVDTIMAVNDYALHAIEAAQSKNSPSVSNMYGIISWRSTDATNAIVTQTFDEAMTVLSTAMQRLILEAEVNVANLNKLEERLSTVHEVIQREGKHLSAEKAEVLSELWTLLGGNKKTLRTFDEHLSMLKNLGIYRKKALAHVVGALQTLQSMSSDMEDIRERVAAPQLTGSKIPIEVHMKSIKSGLKRLKEGRVRSRRLEDEALRRILGMSETDGEDSP